jgi:hypothetical protein
MSASKGADPGRDRKRIVRLALLQHQFSEDPAFYGGP